MHQKSHGGKAGNRPSHASISEQLTGFTVFSINTASNFLNVIIYKFSALYALYLGYFPCSAFCAHFNKLSYS